MKKTITYMLELSLMTLLFACTSMPEGQWKYQAGGTDVAIVSVELPDICIRSVETQSDVAMIRPDYQTVLTQGCNRWDGMGDSPVVWILIEDSSAGDAAGEGNGGLRQIEKNAMQHFSTGSSILKKPERTLKDFLALVKKDSDMPIRIVGHTDSRGGIAINMKLGMKRAQAVAKWLVANGIDRKRIEVDSAGKSEPVESNDTAAGMTANRRAVTMMTLIVTGGEA